ncbi:MAG: hypothetical protein ABJ370_12590 [Paracoccaceae bacterium]
MNCKHTICVFFDGISHAEFTRRLGWEFLVKAWSGSISWRQQNARTIVLELDGIDGLQRTYITRRQIGSRIFIAARRATGELLQTGLWWFDTKSQTACCLRRIYDDQLVETLNERLPDFCFNTFVKEAA